jgi:tetraacyldisaccharide 4'-kinase
MKAPAFWWRPAGLASALLAPAAAIWSAAATRRLGRPGTSAPIPVICVGNVTVGGSGKTPTSIALAGLLRDGGRRPAFLLRGYGGSLAGPVVVDPHLHDASAVGDEALLLAAEGMTIVSRDRPAGADLAAARGADVIVMDDGLQNPSLRKDLTLAVFDGAAGIGNGCALPAGPLRAPLDAQWPLVDAVLIVGAGRGCEAVEAEAMVRGLPVLRASLVPAPEAARALAGRRVLAFAGIGRPEKFFTTCREIGIDVVKERAFADHYRYGRAEIADLLNAADAKGLIPLTTEKDAVRLSILSAEEPRVAEIRTLPVRLHFEQRDVVSDLVTTTIG